MNRTTDLCLTALAPIIWGSSYIVTTEMLPDGYPLTVALLRALPAGLILLLVVRRLPPAGWRGRVFILVNAVCRGLSPARRGGGNTWRDPAVAGAVFGALCAGIRDYDAGHYCRHFRIDRGRNACAWPDQQP